MTGAELPLVSSAALDDVIAWRPEGAVPVRTFLADAQRAAKALPSSGWVVNLCEDRYHFAVVFAACLLTGKTSLQPASHSIQTLGQLARDHAGAFAVTDTGFDQLPLPRVVFVDLQAGETEPVDGIPVIAGERVVAVLFTSGSTGLPQAHGKTWAMLVANGRAEAEGLGLLGSHTALVGTVPVQHSYGFESTFLMALHGGCAFWSGRPFYPQDVAESVQAVPRPRMVVTTPFHLGNMLASDVVWPAVDAWLSATAPLDAQLAAQVEARSGAPVFEIYGSTESSQLAWRRTTAGLAWRLLPGVQLLQSGDETCADGGHVGGRVPLSDLIELQADRRFLLHGRHADLINIAGKRTSLAYLNHQLLAIDGVDDGAFFMPDEPAEGAGQQVVRLAAFVVAPRLTRSVLMAALRVRVDPIFMPRPLVWVEALPRNPMGKLPRSALQSLYGQNSKKASA
ncbi:beta-hydroxyacyl-ACP dehydratase [Hydrogenophaga crassostreae]|uniref:Beta-hydroxyacyl-ACP dehydratase n=1 Tax=Hydrogenophaga crassostreae TaxID=1763535 RepID=A0A167H4Z0_9BURK|nr:beta-hydroxyacyl-ACP dehydratase [Hydrogenophaga crassostreae]OAD40290.1 beta-hydroxyacyl-ACP dehydratase [Hydrogenophaga crassostreae]